MKRLYVAGMRAARAVLAAVGVLRLLDVLSRRSRLASWVRSWFAIYDLDDLATLGVPWWTYRSSDLVGQFLSKRPEARVFEWGSGSSTIWLAHRAAEVISVEHDVAWADTMRPRLPEHVELRAVPPAPVAPGRAAEAITSAKPGHEGLDFGDYVRAIDQVPGRFDLIVIDGRAREACLSRALSRLAPGGWIVFDNVDRQRYLDAIDAQPGLDVLMTRGLTPTLPYPTRTALLRLST